MRPREGWTRGCEASRRLVDEGEGRVSGCRDCARLPLPQYDSVRHDCRHFFATILFPFRKDSHFFTRIQRSKDLLNCVLTFKLKSFNDQSVIWEKELTDLRAVWALGIPLYEAMQEWHHLISPGFNFGRWNLQNLQQMKYFFVGNWQM